MLEPTNITAILSQAFEEIELNYASLMERGTEFFPTYSNKRADTLVKTRLAIVNYVANLPLTTKEHNENVQPDQPKAS